LAAQDVLALLALSALLDVFADPMTDLQLGQALALEPHGELEPLDHVNCLEQLDALFEGDLRSVGGGVCERADLANRAHEGRDAPIVTAELQNFLDDGAVLAFELARPHARRFLVRTLLHLDPEPALGVRVGRAGDSAVQPNEIDGGDAARQAHTFCDLGDGADSCVLPVVPGHEQHAVLVGHVGGDRDGHIREDDVVVKRD
jgi:hypothetical protein